MRNKAGFMALTLLLLTAPALANAWTLLVKVSGASADNYVTTSYKLADGTVSTKKFTGNGTSYLYPTSRVTVTRTGTATPALNFAGFSQYSSVTTLANQTLTVNYASTATFKDLSLTQVAGGSVYAQNLNNTWSSTGVTQAPTGTVVNVTIAADVNHKILGYHTDLNATVQAAGTGLVAGEVVTVPITLTDTETIIPDFVVAGHTTATLFAPTSGVTGTSISVNVTASSNDSPLTYAFVVSPAPAVAGVGGGSSSSFAFTPSAATTYTVTATVTSPKMVKAVVNTATIVVADVIVNANQACVSCHSTQSPTIVANYTASIHGQSSHSACAACHTPATPHSANINALNVNPATFVCTTTAGSIAKGKVFCTACHNPLPHSSNLSVGVTCVQCHTSATGVAGKGDAHQVQGLSCVGCHAVGQSNPFSDKTLVNDNAGVRAVVGEFTKWSHHIVNANGLAPQDEQCAVCHLEGTVGTYGFGVDGTKHMTDNMTHLRNADTDGDLQWNPAAPNHSTMDTFCMSCHDANGATSPMNLKLQALITPLTGKTASPSNPFGDTISNQYDKMARPAVVDAKGQFATGNNSHHAVLGKRYAKRTRVVNANDSRAMTATEVVAFTANSSASLPGTRTTIFDAGKFNSLYTPLGADGTVATSLGDDSTLHCGDCHTVGQYRTADVNTAAGSYNKAVIGAHGSNNEYMLRNNAGTDARHIGASVTTNDGTMPYLVCYNCHNQVTYSINSHAGEEESSKNCNGYENTFGSYTASGSARLRDRKTTGALDTSSYGNIFGIQCAACHNSGLDNGYGGIHGSKVQTYTDGMGNTSKHERFMPGLNNTMFVPGVIGGITGGTGTYTYKAYSSNRKTGSALAYALLPVRNTPYTASQKAGSYSFTIGGATNDTNWEQKSSQPIAGLTNPVAGAMGCYTYGAQGVAKISALQSAGYPADDVRLPATDGIKAVDGAVAFGNWGGCTDHNGAQGKGTAPTRQVLRPVTY